MDIIKEQRALSDKDLAIFNSELQRKSIGSGTAYLLWFFFGGVGIHNLYMGKPYWGLLYSLLGFFSLFAFTANDPLFAIKPFGVLSLLLLWDLFTIPKQIRRREDAIKIELLNKLKAST